MKRNDPIKNLMSAAPHSIQRGQRLSKARQILGSHSFHHLPVLEGKKVVGMLSSNDMLRLSYDFDAIDERSLDAILDHQYSIDQVMQSDVVSIPIESNVRDAAEILAKGEIHSVVVTNDQNELEGIVTSTDMIRYLTDLF